MLIVYLFDVLSYFAAKFTFRAAAYNTFESRYLSFTISPFEEQDYKSSYRLAPDRSLMNCSDYAFAN
jgi:hypothetical protein